MKVSTIVLSLLIFTGVFLTLMTSLSDMSGIAGYDVPSINSTNKAQLASQNLLNNLTTTTSSQTLLVKETDPDASANVDPNYKLGSVFKIILVLPTAFGAVMSVFFTDYIQSYEFWLAIILIIIAFSVLIAVVNAIRRHDH